MLINRVTDYSISISSIAPIGQEIDFLIEQAVTITNTSNIKFS